MADKEITPEQAQEALDKAKNKRLELCATELADILKKHNCKLDATPLIVDGRIVAQVTVAPND